MVYASKSLSAGVLITHSLVKSPTAMRQNVFLLVLTAVVKVGLTAWTFGMMVGARNRQSTYEITTHLL